ncbi:MAG TPA: preprotein translocase subunit SecA, partial [Petrotogaceae bacterium]|nr:preprotein translocase subunit SecA [Petrotogaceae bacterium]
QAVRNKLIQYLVIDDLTKSSVEETKESIINALWKKYEMKKEEFGEDFHKLIKFVMLRIIDERWRAHLDAIEALKESVNLRAYGQKDPVLEFKKESYTMFENLIDSIYDDAVSYLLRIVKVDPNKEEEQTKKMTVNLNFSHNEGSASKNDSKSEQIKKGKKHFKVKK